MDDTSRRKFLATAGAGAAGLAVAGVLSASPAQATGTPSTTVPDGAEGALVAYVRDVKGNQVNVMVGEQEVVVHDSELVARLARAAAK